MKNKFDKFINFHISFKNHIGIYIFLFENKSIVRRCLAHLYNYSLYVACLNGVSRGSILSLIVTPGVHEIIQKCVHHEWNRSIVSDILTMRVIVELKSNRSTILVYFPFKPPPPVQSWRRGINNTSFHRWILVKRGF